MFAKMPDSSIQDRTSTEMIVMYNMNSFCCVYSSYSCLSVLLVWLLVYLLACLFACLFACLLVYLLACLFACLFTCLFACLFACLFVCLFVCLLVCLIVCLLACLFVCMLVCLFVCLFACLFVFLFFWNGCLYSDTNHYFTCSSVWLGRCASVKSRLYFCFAMFLISAYVFQSWSATVVRL